MPKRFVDATEQSLIKLLQETMKQHNPWTGLKGKAVGILRDITIPKPRDAHNLSIFVTEDFLSKISNTYESEHVGSAFMNVLSLADEEVREHYLRANRSPTFARMLIEFRNALKNGYITSSLSDLSTFTDFIDKIVELSKGTDHEITYEKGMFIDTVADVINPQEALTPMERALAESDNSVSGKIKKMTQKKAKSSTEELGLRLGSNGGSGREDIGNSAVEILIGNDYRLLSPDWLLMRSLAIAYLLKRKELGLPVAERCPDQEELEDMFHQERKCAVLLYGCVLLSTYVEEIRQAAIAAYEKANPKVSKILKLCRKVSQHSGKMLVAYTAIMLSSLIATAASGGVGAGAIAGTVLGYTAAGGMLAANAPQLGLLAAQGVKTLGNALGVTTTGAAALSAEAAAATAAAGTAVESTTAAAAAGAEAATGATFASPVALPATVIMTLTTYITFPRVMFSGYEGEWIRKYTESDGGKREFKPPSMWSPLIASMGIKLIMNTLLGFTPHIKYPPFSAALGWSLYRLYLPLSLIEQPSKVRNAYEVAVSATSRREKSNFPYSTKTTVACCLIGLVVELALHAAGFHLPSEVSMALNFLVKTARVAAWIGPVIHARKHGKTVYTREFEQIFWTDGFKALTAPPILLLFELASGSPAFNTAVLAGDILISLIPDIICGNKLGALNVTSGKIVALESLMRTALSQKSILELSIAMAMQDEPSVAQEHMQTLLEKHFGKDKYQDLGLDIKVDEDGTRNLSLEAERKWRTVIENAVSSSEEEDEELSAEHIQDLIKELATVYKTTDTGSANPEAEDDEKVLRALESQHTFLAVLRGSTLTEEQKAAMKDSADRLSKLDANTRKKIQLALDDFEAEYHDRLIATMTDSQREMLAQVVDQLLEEIKLPDTLDAQKKAELEKSVRSFRDRIKAWDGNKNPWEGISPNLDVSDLNKILEQPEHNQEFLDFFGANEDVLDPFGPSAFDRQFVAGTSAASSSTCDVLLGGQGSTQKRATHGPRTVGKAQPDKSQKCGSGGKKYVEVAGEIVRGDGSGKATPATKQPGRGGGSAKPGDWGDLVMKILESDDAEREEAIGAMLRGELPQQSAQGESPQAAKERGSRQARQETSLFFGAKPGEIGKGAVPGGEAAADSTVADDDEDIEGLFKTLLTLPKKMKNKSDAEVERYLNSFLSGLNSGHGSRGQAQQAPLFGTQSGKIGKGAVPGGEAAAGSTVADDDEDIEGLFKELLALPHKEIMSKSDDEVGQYLLQQLGQHGKNERGGQEAARGAQSTNRSRGAGIEVLEGEEHALSFLGGMSSSQAGTVFEYSNSQQPTGGQQKPSQKSGATGLKKPQMVTQSSAGHVEEFEIEIDNLPKHNADVTIRGLKQQDSKGYGEDSIELFFGEDEELFAAGSTGDYSESVFAQYLASSAPQKSRATAGARPKTSTIRSTAAAEAYERQPSSAAQTAQRLLQKTAARPAGKVTLGQLWGDSYDFDAGPSRVITGSSAVQPGDRSSRAK
ncbi:MAG: hypothetical protein AB8U40_01295 [Anaplasma ovis]